MTDGIIQKDKCFLCERILPDPHYVVTLPDQTIQYICFSCKEQITNEMIDDD